jgi:hypothetical protein
MITNDLYNTVLLAPAKADVQNELYIVSGYASATFLRRHLADLTAKKMHFTLHLIIGMPSRKSDHEAFLQLHEAYPDNFKGYYYNGAVPLHSKVYAWFLNQTPACGFAGSANYSQYGFFSDKQINQMSNEAPQLIKNFYDTLRVDAIAMTEVEVESPTVESIPTATGSIAPGQIQWLEPNRSVRISFLDKNGDLPGTSGLNWGQRRERRINKKTGAVTFKQREPNQAYLSIKKTARAEGFLPEKGFTFTMLTDDKVVMDCVVAQDGRKSVQTTNDNSELGRYMRGRLGVPNGTFLTAQHLEDYGRTDFTLIKIDDETFLFDFSV